MGNPIGEWMSPTESSAGSQDEFHGKREKSCGSSVGWGEFCRESCRGRESRREELVLWGEG